jgi:hypothetical protein
MSNHPASTEPPSAVTTSVNIVWALVALAVVSTILSFVYLDELVETGAGTGLSDAQQDAARAGGIIGAVIGFLIFGALWVALGIFLRKGANWARIVLTVLTVIGLVVGVFGLLAQDQPVLLLIVNLVTLALYGALLYFLWQKESTAYLTAANAH